MRCRKPRLWSVFGGFFTPGGAGSGDEYLPYGHWAAPWFLASQLVVELNRCTEERTGTAPAP